MGDIEKKPQRADEEENAQLVVRAISRIAEVPAAEWDDCARGAAPSPT